MARPKKLVKQQAVKAVTNTEHIEEVQPTKAVSIKDLPLYVTIIGCGGTLVIGKEYPKTHRNIAVKLILKGVATLKQ